MKILPLNYTYNAPLNRVSFSCSNFNTDNKLKADTFDTHVSYMANMEKDKSNNLVFIKFKQPVELKKVFAELGNTEDDYIREQMDKKLHPQGTLIYIAEQLNKNPKIGDIKVKALIGLGAYAFAFETVDGDVVKISDINHFPNNRKPDDFDLPIKKRGSLGDCYYYIEEKITQEDLTQEELRTLVKYIKGKGYTMRDYLVHFDDDDPDAIIKTRQFGRTKDGKVYLIDPGCATKPPSYYFNIKHLKNKIKEKFGSFNFSKAGDKDK